MSKFIFYFKHPHYIIKDIKCWQYSMYMRFLNWCRKRIYNYEFNKVLNRKITEPTYGTYVSDVHIGIFSPILVITKTLDHYFGFNSYIRLHIHGIDVDTQKEIIEVTFRIHRPGSLIGKAGKDINEIQNRLEAAFNKRVHISINEVRKDINEPIIYF